MSKVTEFLLLYSCVFLVLLYDNANFRLLFLEFYGAKIAGPVLTLVMGLLYTPVDIIGWLEFEILTYMIVRTYSGVFLRHLPVIFSHFNHGVMYISRGLEGIVKYFPRISPHRLLRT